MEPSQPLISLCVGFLTGPVNHCCPGEKGPAPMDETCLKQVFLPGALDGSAALGSRLFIGAQDPLLEETLEVIHSPVI